MVCAATTVSLRRLSRLGFIRMVVAENVVQGTIKDQHACLATCSLQLTAELISGYLKPDDGQIRALNKYYYPATETLQKYSFRRSPHHISPSEAILMAALNLKKAAAMARDKF